MSEPHHSAAPTTPADAALSDALARGVSDVISAAIGVGTSVAKAFADATARGKPVAPVGSGSGLEAFIHYGVAAVTNVMGMVASGIETGTCATAAAPRPAPGAARASSEVSEPVASDSTLPVVHAGGRLRIPLSIENTSAEPLSDVAVRCARITSSNGGDSDSLRDIALVRCEPPILSISPRDFEKTTVFIETSPSIPSGRYEAVIAIGSSGFESRVGFDVRPFEGASAA
jgi:hypothetical protein